MTVRCIRPMVLARCKGKSTGHPAQWVDLQRVNSRSAHEQCGLTLALRHTSDPRVAGAFFFGVPEVEHGRAAWHITGGSIIGADHAIPESIRDAVVAVLVVKMVEQVQLLDSTQEPTPRRIVQYGGCSDRIHKRGC